MAEKEGSTKKEKWWWTGLLLPVVAGILVEVLTDVEVFSTLWGWVKTIGTTPIPLWLAILLVVGAVGAVFGWAWFMRSLHEDDVPEHYSFTKLRLFGVDWEWRWYGGDIGHPLMLCPSCENQLDFQQESIGDYYSGGETTTYKTECENCGFTERFETRESEVLRRVNNEVLRLFRTGEYKKRLESKSEDV